MRRGCPDWMAPNRKGGSSGHPGDSKISLATSAMVSHTLDATDLSASSCRAASSSFLMCACTWALHLAHSGGSSLHRTRFSMTAANWRCAMLPLVRMVASRQPDSASGCALSLAKSASALERPSLSGSMSCATSVSKLAPPDSAALTSADSMTLDLGTEEARSTAPAGGRDWGLRGGGARRVAARAGCPSPTVVAQPKTQPPATEANAH
mmetsp:Transcript_11530/g.34149  ORF Transcript_11530/g.34149 Transcript_11530/m.34149 type:complete len:209 (-) Transcript_11530:158-784(-)